MADDQITNLDDNWLGWLNLSVRTRNALTRQKILTVRQLVEKSEDELRRHPGIGWAATRDIEVELARYGLKLGTKPKPPSAKDEYHRGWWNAAECFRERRECNLSRRDHFAKAAMQTLLGREVIPTNTKAVAVAAREMADDMLAALDKKPE